MIVRKMIRKSKTWWSSRLRNEKDEKDSGFTFIETLAVLAIMALLTAGAGVSTMQIVEHARSTECKEQLSVYKSALQSYYVDCGRFPTTAQGLEALWSKPLLMPVPEKWNGPYVDRQIQMDPWGNEYVYLQEDTSAMPENAPVGLPFVIQSLGADGVRGGSGRNADVNSWD